jgi:hypothetical protein
MFPVPDNINFLIVQFDITIFDIQPKLLYARLTGKLIHDDEYECEAEERYITIAQHSEQ